MSALDLRFKMKKPAEHIDKVFSALADGNRRKIIELLHQKEYTLLELSESFSISFQALSKHIYILERAGIVKKEKQGKYRFLQLNKNSFQPSLKWISYFSGFWNGSFDKLENIINQKNASGNAE